MGVNKKFLLLAFLMIVNELYCDIGIEYKGISAENGNVQTNEKNFLEIKKGNEGIRLNSNAGKNDITNKAQITVNGGTGVKLNVNNDTGKNIFSNIGTITVETGIGADLYNSKEGNNKFYNGSDTGTGQIIVNGGTGITLNSKNGIVTNDKNGSIIINSGTGIKLNNLDSKIINNGNITINNSGIGIELVGGIVDNNKDLIINNGTGLKITVSNGTFNNNDNGNIVIENGIGIIQSTGVFNNKIGSTITVNNGKGFDVSGNSQTNNNGTIIVNKGIGITQNSGTVTNKVGGVINITGGTVGIDQKAGTFINETGGKINITGGKGFYVTGGTVENSGIIDVNSVTGLQLKGSSVKFENKNLIKVSSKEENEKIKGGIGVIVSEKRNDGKATFDNQGRIEVEFGAKGIQVGKGIAENNGTIISEGTNATGVYVNGDGIPKVGSDGKPLKDENGKIIMSGKYEKAEFTNNNQIITSGTGAKGIQFGSGSGKVTNTGDIIAENGSIGVFFYQGTNNILINSGIINAGENGSAIESGQNTNNTVILQAGSEITGKIKGNNGIDVLALDGGTHSKLNVSDYEKIVAKSGDSKIENSTISLGFKEGTDKYISENIGKAEGNVTIADSKLIIDLANKTENSTGLISGQTILDGNIKLAFNGAKGEKEFNVNEILNEDIDFSKANFGSSAMWDYTTENGDLIAKKKSYTEAVGKSQLEDFGKALEQSENGEIKDGDFKTGLTLLGLLDASQFTDAMTQLSGGVHGYTVDFAAINSRTLSNAIKNRELNKERLRDKALNSYDQEVAYINNHHKLGGLMNVDYNEDGVLGITEKQIMPNGKLGLVYGGAKGKAKFENGKHGKADMDNLYLGGYYAYDFTDKLTLVSNANFVYSHTNVTRNIKFSKESKEGDVSKLEQTYDSTYPVFGFGGGATLYYTPYNSLNNSVTLYGGIDWTKIVQGNINEDSDNTENKTNVTIKNLPVDEQMYDSVVPHIGLSLSNNGYIFNRKYRLGVNVDYETELGNIKNGKKLKLSALSTPHRVETAERENIVSYSLNGALDLTEDFTIYGNYTKADSDEYDAERVEAGFKYKMDRMSDLFVTGPLLGNIENSKSYSRRWTGVASFILDGEDDSDRSYYNHIDKDSNQSHSRGDYATSLKLKPKFTLSLNDRDTKWSYYFETYYMSNGMGMNLDKNERRKSESRIHAEARWSDQYSKGRYGFNIGYRNETTSSPTLSQYVQRDRLTRGLHQFRFTPNFTYNLGNGFIFGGSTTGIIAYDYEGYRKGQTDFELENEYGITYNGLMPRWRFNVNYFREETWYDNDFRKPSVKGEVEGDRRYQSNQLRPRITYFFGNGGRVELSARMPLGNGYWYNSDDNNKKTAEKYETRYGIKYYQPITPGLTGMIGGEILTIKTKNTDHGNSNYGKETRDYSIRPTIGISYNF